MPETPEKTKTKGEETPTSLTRGGTRKHPMLERREKKTMVRHDAKQCLDRLRKKVKGLMRESYPPPREAEGKGA